MASNHSPKTFNKSPTSSVSSLGEQLLSHAQSGREVVQDFCPLADSLEWELGQQYLRERGNKAVTSDASPVPFVINNDGGLSRNAAEVLFASLVEADKTGTLENEIFVLELGIGVGLFARFLLDHFKELCRKNKKDYYDRLCYVAADRSERMLKGETGSFWSFWVLFWERGNGVILKSFFDENPTLLKDACGMGMNIPNPPHCRLSKTTQE